ncbi:MULTISPECIES: hypothetical protein [unclassified Sphingopyxis]|uniref:SCO4402 family protein n=2 Tax=unclassified Sphingopyxis TaxID=2614943 RepID=UPI00073159B6|nr:MULTISPECIES: hypothetical protein [unclassified Sphingopyxis]KTE74473.1 hypothetical protein ATE60_00105 [Sphingopyxis sp. H081]KTE25454.1 hypothetical protein ATE61_10265 [Sphingopyxis sp. H057]KTE53475.1 hypothetical protein ATE64_06195 [Sphingopyxis sp. H073]KTE67033.1 hypothetical protein ATE65_03040 [Sphingopyxis sp. H100]KTE81525.1 hypothetical protein ATE63_05565 [Sphingopyxis sp. H067]
MTNDGKRPVADIAVNCDHSYPCNMADNHSFLPSSLANPEKREELILYLKELAAEDPEELWRNAREQGLVSDIDQIFHFFFDDNDFDEGAVGYSLLDVNEAKVIGEVKALLDAMLMDLPNGNDVAFVSHHLWPRLRAMAQEAQSLFEARS